MELENVKYKYSDKKPKRMWVSGWIELGYDAIEEYNYGYNMIIEIGLNKGVHTYVKGNWCYNTKEDTRPFEWEEAKKHYNIDFDKYIKGALEFAIKKGYCK